MNIKNKVISERLKRPGKFPDFKKIGVSEEVAKNILEENKLLKIKRATETSLKLKMYILKDSIVRNTVNQIIENCKKEFKFDEEVIEEMIFSLKLSSDANLMNYKKIFNEEVVIKTKKEEIFYCDIILQIVFNKVLSDSIIENKNIKEMMLKCVNNINISFQGDLNFNKAIEFCLKYFGIKNEKYISILNEVAIENKEIIDELYEKLPFIEDDKHNEVEENNDIADAIGDLLMNGLGETTSEDLKVKDIKIENITKEEVKEVKKSESKSNDKIFESLKNLAENLGYKVADENEIVIKKERYEQQINEESVKFIKEIVKYEKGAALSDLYNAYLNIKTISKEEMELVLDKFFTTLMVSGLEVQDSGEVGQIISKSYKSILKDFKVNKKIDKCEMVKGTILYKGWNFKGKQVEPMIIKVK